MEKTILLLIKIFKEEDERFADSFLENGEMYCQTLNAFKAIEDDNVRGDKYEGVTHWFQPEAVAITLSRTIDGSVFTHTIPSNDFAAPITISTTAYDHHNIFCMYAISINGFRKSYESEDERKIVVAEINKEIKEQIKIDSETSKFGNHAIVIYKVAEFIDKIKAYVDLNKIKLHHKLVNYFDENSHNGIFYDIDAIFHKTQTYDFQNEYRFAFDINSDGLSKVIKIGALKDLAIKTKLQDLEHHLSISLKE